MSVRDFDPAGFPLIQTISPAVPAGGVTLLALVHPDNVTSTRNLVAMTNPAGTTAGYQLYLDNNGAIGLYNNAVLRNSANSLVTTGAWYLVAITKGAGAVVPRFHVYNFATLTWTHANHVSTSADAPAMTATDFCYLGYSPSIGNHYDGRMALAGVWASALSDGTLEGLITGNQVSTTALAAASATAWWKLTQPNRTWPLVDETTGKSDQEDINATTVDPSVAPITDPSITTYHRGDFLGSHARRWEHTDLVGVGSALAFGTSSPAPPTGETTWARFTVPAGQERSEVMQFVHLVEGDTAYFKWHSRVAAGLSTADEFQVVWQLHTQGAISPALALEARQGQWWFHNNDLANGVGPTDVTVYQTPYVEDTWVKFEAWVYFSQNPDRGSVILKVDDVEVGAMHLRTLYDAFNFPELGLYRGPSHTGSGVVYNAGHITQLTTQNFEPLLTLSQDLVAGTPENINDVQENFDDIVTFSDEGISDGHLAADFGGYSLWETVYQVDSYMQPGTANQSMSLARAGTGIFRGFSSGFSGWDFLVTSGNGVTGNLPLIYIDTDDFRAPGLTSQIRLQALVAANSIGFNSLTFELCRFTPGQNLDNLQIAAFGTAVASVSITPVASSLVRAVSTPITAPVDGTYLIKATLTDGGKGGTGVGLASVEVQRRHV